MFRQVEKGEAVLQCRWRLTGDGTHSMVNQSVHRRVAETLDNVLAAIADPTRRAIIARLTHGSARISDVAAPFPMSLTGFCKHVRILEHAGLVKRTRHGRENTLELSARPLHQVAEWVLNYERFWSLRMERLEKFFVAKKEKSR